jgi:lysophospholipid acyltransferase (LPLAT)-like uncharacterized protein
VETPSSNSDQRPRKPYQLSGKRLWLTRLGYIVIRLVTPTLRWRIHDPEKIADQIVTFPVIFCIWHNRLALALPIWHRFRRSRKKSARMAAISSASKDGAIVAGILERFGAQPVRGSSSRRGVHAMIEMVKWGKKGFDLAVTPDGPRGPKYSVQPGIISLAQMTGFPILPISYSLSRKITLKSWDNFQIPLPFSRCDIYCNELIRCPRELEDREQAAANVRDRLLAITKD